MSPEPLPCARVVGSLRCYLQDLLVDTTKEKNPPSDTGFPPYPSVASETPSPSERI